MALVLVFAGISIASPAQAATISGGWTAPLASMPGISAGFLANNCGYSGYGTYEPGLYHLANDYGAAAGTNVYAIGSGTVVAKQENWPGSAVFVKHTAADGTQFLAVYGHLSNAVAANTTVNEGQLIGQVYNDGGNSHLHFGVRAATVPASTNNGHMPCSSWPDANGFVDPMPYLSAHPHSSGFAEGAFVQATDTGKLYRIAGGSPMYVTSLSNVPWTGQYQTTTQSVIDSMPMYPADGTKVRDYVNGTVYVVAGGKPMYVTSMSNVPASPAVIDVDGWAINHLRSQPADGTVLRNYVTGQVYVVVGNAPMSVMSMSSIPYTQVVDVDGWSIANQLQQYPADGSVFVDYNTSVVYVVAGHAALQVVSFSNIPPVNNALAYVDDWAVQNQLLRYPVDGTVIRNYTTGAIYVVAGGSAITITSLTHVPYQNWVEIDGWAITNQLRSYPADGTYIKGYESGEEFVSNGSAITRVTTTPLPSATIVDDWAITNQLGGTL